MISARSVVSPARLASLHPVAVADAALLGVVRMDLEPILLVPDDIGGAAGLRADIVLAEDAAGGEQQRIARAGLFVGRDVLGDDELALAADEARRCA